MVLIGNMNGANHAGMLEYYFLDVVLITQSLRDLSFSFVANPCFRWSQ